MSPIVSETPIIYGSEEILSPETTTEEEYKSPAAEKKKPQRLEGVTEIPDASAFVANLAGTRPALAALNGLISSFPIPKIFASNGIPLMMYMRDNEEQEAQNKM